MSEYGFEEEKELKNYKESGTRGEYKNYQEWEKGVFKKYVSISEIQFFTNFKGYLKQQYNKYKHSNDIIMSLWIPLITLFISLTLAIPSVFIGVVQYQDSLQSDIDNTYIENMIRDGAERNEIIIEQVDNLQNRLDQNEKCINYVMGVLIFVYIVLIVIGVMFTRLLKSRLSKLLFYDDYMNVIDKISSEKYSLISEN